MDINNYRTRLYKFVNRFMPVAEFAFLLSLMAAFLLEAQGITDGRAVMIVFSSQLALVYFYVAMSMSEKPELSPFERHVGKLLYWTLSVLVVGMPFSEMHYLGGDVMLKVGTIG